MEPPSLRPFRDALLARGHPVPALVVHAGVVTAINEAARRLLGERARPEAELAGLFDPASHPKLSRALEGQAPGLWELQARTPEGVRPLFFLVVPTRDEALLVGTALQVDGSADLAGRLLEANGVLAELLREQAHQAVELRAARDRLAELGALRDDFIATLSHDVRAPLTAIQLQVALLEGMVGGAEGVAARLQAIRRAVDRILDLSHSVLDSARLDAGTLPLRPADTALRSVAEAAAEALAPLAARAGVRLEVAGPEGRLEGDRVLLGQVLTNLLDNAIRHSPRGGRVAVEVEERDGWVRCAVRDAGPGVPPELRARIFERFRQQGPGGASGLGLYIARQVVELHRGSIHVEDAAPGARFVVELPRRVRA